MTIIKKTITVASGDDAAWLVCLPWPEGEAPYLPDNQFGICAECGARVQHRPNIPKNPKLICATCFEDDHELALNSEWGITPETLAEVRAEMKKKSQ